eukprot:6521174-Lingulodinium_polyedra.AAC.1
MLPSSPKTMSISCTATSMPPDTTLVGPNNKLPSKATTTADRLPATSSAKDRLMTPNGNQQSPATSSTSTP